MLDEERDPWVSWVSMALYATGAMYALIGVIFAAGMVGIGFGAMTDAAGSDGPVTLAVLTGQGVVILVVMLAFATVNFVGGWGFARQAKWGWFVALVLGCIYAPSLCFPIGAVILYGCLNDRTRKTFLG